MNIKLIALDLDGTLLKSDKTVSDFTLSALEKCRQKGILIAIATTRSERQAIRYIEKIMPDITVSNSGALATHNGKILYESVLSQKVSDAIISDLAINKDVKNITVNTSKNYYRSYLEPDKSFAGFKDFIHGDYYDFNKPLSQAAHKISAEIINRETAEKIAKKHNVNLTAFTGENWFKFASAAADKFSAINAAAQHLGISINEIAAFGDDYNDIEIVSNVGIGIAMGNAIPELKSTAKYICGTNDNDGVANWLYKFVIHK